MRWANIPPPPPPRISAPLRGVHSSSPLGGGGGTRGVSTEGSTPFAKPDLISPPPPQSARDRGLAVGSTCEMRGLDDADDANDHDAPARGTVTVREDAAGVSVGFAPSGRQRPRCLLLLGSTRGPSRHTTDPDRGCASWSAYGRGGG